VKRPRQLGDLTTIDEYGVRFETGVPVTVRYVRNTERSGYYGATYQQDIEPAGRYMVHAPMGGAPPRGWERGEVRFERPLVLELNERGGGYDEHSWKAWLVRRYGKTGRALTCALRRDGYDGVVTVGTDSARRPVDTREIVDLRGVKCGRTRRRR
jgi:hypothetical protein